MRATVWHVVLDISLRGAADRRFRDVLTPKQINQARARAANRAAAAGRREGANETAQATGLGKPYVRKRITTSRATGAKPVARIRAQGGPENLRAFGARQLRRGVRAKPYGNRRLFPGTFQLPDGRVFTRDPGRQNPSRPGPLTAHSQGLSALFGPGVAQTFQEGVSRRTARGRAWQRMVRDRLSREFGSALQGQVRAKAARAARRAAKRGASS